MLGFKLSKSLSFDLILIRKPACSWPCKANFNLCLNSIMIGCVTKCLNQFNWNSWLFHFFALIVYMAQLILIQTSLLVWHWQTLLSNYKTSASFISLLSYCYDNLVGSWDALHVINWCLFFRFLFTKFPDIESYCFTTVIGYTSQLLRAMVLWTTCHEIAYII